jgi:hypothetical protein
VSALGSPFFNPACNPTISRARFPPKSQRRHLCCFYRAPVLSCSCECHFSSLPSFDSTIATEQED